MGEPLRSLEETAQDEQLQAAFLDACDGDWEGLDRMMRSRLRERLADHVHREAMKVVVDQLFQWATREGRLEELIRAACREFRYQPLIARAAERGWAPGPEDSPADAAASVRIGLRALGELLQEAGVREALSAFGALFEGADRRIQHVADLKALHDRLHDLQLRYYAPIAGAIRAFPSGTSPRQLQLYGIMLCGEVEKLRQIARRESLATEDLAWIEENLEAARTLLDAAVEQRQTAPLREVVRLLRDVVQTEPTRVDALLLGAVKHLDLPQLVKTVREVSAELAKVGADAEQRLWVEKAATELGVLHQALADGRLDHGAWQKVENSVSMFEASLGQSHDEIRQAWLVLQRTTAKPLQSAEPWAARLREVAGLVASSIESGDPAALAETFSHFQVLTSDRFYQVDQSLKELCEQIIPIGSELDKVVRQIG